MEPTVAPTEELIGGERVQLRQSAVRAIKAPVILEAKLFVGTEKSFLISLTKETLYFSRPDDKAVHQGAATISPLSLMAAVTSSIDLYDILAVEGVNEAAVKTDNAPRRPAHFILHTFRWKDPQKREKRKYAKLVVICANPAEKDRWVSRIDLLLRSHPDSMHDKRFKVLVNPFSGSKTASAIWAECEVLFKMSGVRYDVTNTAYARHAKEIASQIDLRQYHAIVTVSGDGLLFEVVNGLMERSDWQRALSLLLGAIPAGSGNGLARSVGTSDPVTTTFEVLKGRRRKMDLMHIVQDKSSCYAFLSVTWGLFADIDLESETMRWMGDVRFTVAAMRLVASPRSYKGRVSWLPAALAPAAGAAAPAAAPAAASPSVTESHPLDSAPPPLSSPSEAAAAQPASPEPASDASPSATTSQLEPVVPAGVPAAVSQLALSAASILSPPPPAELPEPIALAPGTLLTPEGKLRDALLEAGVSAENGWITHEKPWSVFIASNVTHLSATACAAPKKKWGEGSVDLIISTTNERTDLLAFLLNLDDGSWVTKTQALEYHKVRAFVIEPLCKEGLFSLDGEHSEYTPLKCELHPGLLNILG